jgi:hypothetical protein
MNPQAWGGVALSTLNFQAQETASARASSSGRLPESDRAGAGALRKAKRPSFQQRTSKNAVAPVCAPQAA